MGTPREEILGCACDLLLEEGREGFSMRRLARAVGVTAPALYRHYEGRDDVLAAVVGEAFKVFYQYLYDALRGSTPAERLSMASEAYLEFALDHPRFYEMIHAPLDAIGLEALPEDIASRACAVGRFWHDRLRECIDTGFIRAEEPEQIGITMWAHSHGLISLYLRGLMEPMDVESFKVLYRESWKRALRGVATEEGARDAVVAPVEAAPGDDDGGPDAATKGGARNGGAELADVPTRKGTGNGGEPI